MVSDRHDRLGIVLAPGLRDPRQLDHAGSSPAGSGPGRGVVGGLRRLLRSSLVGLGCGLPGLGGLGVVGALLGLLDLGGRLLLGAGVVLLAQLLDLLLEHLERLPQVAGDIGELVGAEEEDEQNEDNDPVPGLPSRQIPLRLFVFLLFSLFFSCFIGLTAG